MPDKADSSAAFLYIILTEGPLTEGVKYEEHQ